MLVVAVVAADVAADAADDDGVAVRHGVPE